MKLERIDKDSLEHTKVCNERRKFFGNASGNWYCDKCKYLMNSFIYNFDYHIPETCPQCNEGKMIENESERSIPSVPNMIDKSREKNWEQGLTPMQQASVLLGESDPY